MGFPSLRIAAARYILDLATGEELVAVADQLLTNGVYSYSLGELGTFRHPTLADVGPLFLAAMEDLEIPMPSWDEALQTLIGIHVVAIAEEAVKPIDGLGELFSLYAALRNSARVLRDAKLLEPLDQFVQYFYVYDAFRNEVYLAEQGVISVEIDHEAAKALDLECIRFAAEWCRARWASSIDRAWLTATVIALAKGIRDEKAFDRLPILADALQDAGCDSGDILDHCRRAGPLGGRGALPPCNPHVRGCWVVDLVLDKE